MQGSPHDAYLVAQVTTAPPQKLHLMLIEGAIRFIHKAQQHWIAKEAPLACEALIRAQEIVGEILAGLKREIDPNLVKRVAAIYAFVLRSLVEGATRRDEGKLADALRILDIERETWREICRQTDGGQPRLAPNARPPATPNPTRISDNRPAEDQLGQFSFEA